jgi:hypothetical protein
MKQNPIKKQYFASLSGIVDRVKERYQGKVGGEVEVVPDAALTVITWMEAESWGDFSALIRLSGAAEGDVARLVTQTADHLNQISRLTESHPLLAKAAMEGRRHLLRPPLSDEFMID